MISHLPPCRHNTMRSCQTLSSSYQTKLKSPGHKYAASSPSRRGARTPARDIPQANAGSTKSSEESEARTCQRPAETFRLIFLLPCEQPLNFTNAVRTIYRNNWIQRIMMLVSTSDLNTNCKERWQHSKPVSDCRLHDTNLRTSYYEMVVKIMLTSFHRLPSPSF